MGDILDFEDKELAQLNEIMNVEIDEESKRQENPAKVVPSSITPPPEPSMPLSSKAKLLPEK